MFYCLFNFTVSGYLYASYAAAVRHSSDYSQIYTSHYSSRTSHSVLMSFKDSLIIFQVYRDHLRAYQPLHLRVMSCCWFQYSSPVHPASYCFLHLCPSMLLPGLSPAIIQLWVHELLSPFRLSHLSSTKTTGAVQHSATSFIKSFPFLIALIRRGGDLVTQETPYFMFPVRVAFWQKQLHGK